MGQPADRVEVAALADDFARCWPPSRTARSTPVLPHDVRIVFLS